MGAFMDRRTVLAALGAVAAARPSPAQEAPRWSAPVIDMHFHMRRTPELNIAHQQGAGVTAANLLTRGDAAFSVAALQAGDALPATLIPRLVAFPLVGFHPTVETCAAQAFALLVWVGFAIAPRLRRLAKAPSPQR